MSAPTILTLALLLVALGVSIGPLGRYMARVYAPGDKGAPGDRVFLPVERLLYRFCRVDPRREQRWTIYTLSLLAFSATSVLLLYLLQRVQALLPLDLGLPGVSPQIAWNTAVSFVTNTNWQSYAGESTMGHAVQMVGLAVQNFASAAVGLAVAVALIRGLSRRQGRTLGNFWVDLTRGVTRILLPLAFVFALVLVSQGVVQNLRGATEARPIDTSALVSDDAVQTVPGGPVASQEAIKELGTNGGGFYNANSAHPFENPNGFTNFVQLYLILLIPLALPITYGVLVGSRRQGRVVLGVMATLWLASTMVATLAEVNGNPKLDPIGVEQAVSASSPGGNLEGKEVRFGPGASSIFAAATTGTSTGAVNASHDSFTPIGGMVPITNMLLGEVSPGGVGAGMVGLLINALLAVFIAGLMVGRTPEFLGKKIQAAEIKLVVLYVVVMPAAVLALAGASMVMDTALAGRLNEGPHGLAEIAYAFGSAGNNNGSAFSGLTATSDWYTTALGVAMLMGRFLLIIPALAIGGSLVRKQKVPVSAGTFPTDTPLFGGLVVGVILIVAGLTFFPMLALGPIVEHLSL